MKNRIKNWWNRPITRGDYTKWCLGSLVFSAIAGAGTYVYLRHEQKKLYDLKDDSREDNE